MARSGYGARARRAVRALRAVPRRTAFPVTTACLALVAGCGLLRRPQGLRTPPGVLRLQDHVRDRPGRHRLAYADHQQMEQGAPERPGPAALPATGGQRPARPARRGPPGPQLPVRRDRHGRRVDRAVRQQRLDHPAEGLLDQRLPGPSGRHGQVCGPAVRGARLHQRRPAVLPHGPGEETAGHLGQLAADAQRLRREDHLDGYAATLAPYEGLTVNFTEAQQSKGGSFLAGHGSTVTVNSQQATAALEFLVNGIKAGWIPPQDRTYEETQAQNQFLAGKFVFLNMWPDAYTAATTAGPATRSTARSESPCCPGRARSAARTSLSAPTPGIRPRRSTSSNSSPTRRTSKSCSPRAASPQCVRTCTTTQDCARGTPT